MEKTSNYSVWFWNSDNIKQVLQNPHFTSLCGFHTKVDQPPQPSTSGEFVAVGGGWISGCHLISKASQVCVGQPKNETHLIFYGLRDSDQVYNIKNKKIALMERRPPPGQRAHKFQFEQTNKKVLPVYN